MIQKIREIFDAILTGDQEKITNLIQIALDEEVHPSEILNNGMISAMSEVGRLFEEGEYFVPEMLISARAMQKGLKILKPHLILSGVKSTGTVVAGTVKGDLHDIGKNLVCMMLEGNGFTVVDLGTDISPALYLAAIHQYKPDILAMSALLTTTMPNMKQTIEKIEEAGLRDKIKVIIGGAPITENYAIQIGADGYAPDASRAVKLANSLLN